MAIEPARVMQSREVKHNALLITQILCKETESMVSMGNDTMAGISVLGGKFINKYPSLIKSKLIPKKGLIQGLFPKIEN